MDARDREAIEGLFTRIEGVGRQAGPRDAEAERLIAERVQGQPAAPYYLAQTVVMQDLALKTMQARIDELEEAANARLEVSEGGGFSQAPAIGPASAARTSVPGVGARGPWSQAEPQPSVQSSTPAQQAYAPQQLSNTPPLQGFGGRMGGGGFLAGAAQTAMGVAGGMMLGNALGSMFGGHGGLFGGGGGATENVTNVYEAPQDDVRDLSNTATAGDQSYEDASYDAAGMDDGSAGDDSGYEDV